MILAGPTCDSADVLYEKTSYELPLDLAVGDRIDILSAGAYTSSYASVGFNGFPPLRTYCLLGRYRHYAGSDERDLSLLDELGMLPRF